MNRATQILPTLGPSPSLEPQPARALGWLFESHQQKGLQIQKNDDSGQFARCHSGKRPILTVKNEVDGQCGPQRSARNHRSQSHNAQDQRLPPTDMTELKTRRAGATSAAPIARVPLIV